MVPASINLSARGRFLDALCRRPPGPATRGWVDSDDPDW